MSKFLLLSVLLLSLRVESEINRRRIEMGLRPLRHSEQLAEAARLHAQYLHDSGQFCHEGCGDGGVIDRLKKAGYTGQWMGEVLAGGYIEVIGEWGVVDGWWGSLGHYTILTSNQANEIGCAWIVDVDSDRNIQVCVTGQGRYKLYLPLVNEGK